MPLDIRSLLGSLLQQNGGELPPQGETATTPMSVPLQMPGLNPGAQFQDNPDQPAVQAPKQADEFDNQLAPLLEQLKGGTAAIEKKKKEEYYRNLGILPGKETDFMSRIKRGLKEFNTASDAQKAGIPYLNPNERFQDAAQKEYEKTYPLIKTEVQELRKAKTAKEVNERMIEIQKQKDAAAESKVKAQEETKRTLNNFKGLRTMSLIGGDTAKAEYTKAMSDHMKQVTKNIEEQNPNDSQIMKTYKAAQKIAEDTDTPIEEVVKSLGSMQAAIKPDNSPFSKVLKGNPDMNPLEAYNKMHPKSSGTSVQLIPTTETDTEGNESKGWGTFDKNSRSISALTTPIKPFDANEVKVSQAFKAGGTQANAAFSDAVSAVQNMEDQKFTGPWEGNPVSKVARVFGISGDKGPFEALRDVLASNATLMHTKAMMGGSRYALQAANDMKKLLATGGAASTKSLLYGLGALKYSIDLGKLGNAGIVKDEEITPTVMARIHNELMKAVETAHADKLWNQTNPGGARRQTRVVLRSVKDIIEEDKKQIPQKKDSSLKAKYGF